MNFGSFRGKQTFQPLNKYYEMFVSNWFCWIFVELSSNLPGQRSAPKGPALRGGRRRGRAGAPVGQAGLCRGSGEGGSWWVELMQEITRTNLVIRYDVGMCDVRVENVHPDVW